MSWRWNMLEYPVFVFQYFQQNLLHKWSHFAWFITLIQFYGIQKILKRNKLSNVKFLVL